MSSGPTGISGWMRSEKIVSPTASCLPTCSRNVSEPLLGAARAGSRRSSSRTCRRPAARSPACGPRARRGGRGRACAARAGRARASGCAGSTPFSFEIGATGSLRRGPPAGSRSAPPPRARSRRRGTAGSARRRRAARGVTQSRVEHDEGVVRVEGALGRVERDQLRLAAAALVEVEQRHLLHRDRRGVAGAVLAHLVGDEERGVAVVDDRALDVAHDLARLRAARRPARSAPPSCRSRRSTRRPPPPARRSRSPGWCARA